MSAAPDDRPWMGRRLHFVGIGGAGMSGLALVAAGLGARVTGSDRAESSYLPALREAGVEPAIGHAAEHVPEDAEVVYSTAVPPENPERAVAAERGQAELHRADLLGEITALRDCIGVTGTHGKTTTSSMVVHALRGCGADPAYLVGGKLRSTGTNAGWGAGHWLVVEADESDRSLLKLHPDIAVLTNCELEHHATYGSLRDLEDTFRAFLAGAREAVIWDRPELLALRDAGETVPFDVGSVEVDATGTRFDWRGHPVHMPVIGRHNALNAVAALEACRLAGADEATAVTALADFEGAARRFERLGDTPAGATVIDDYAHHPTEVEATLEAARALEPERIVAVLQPHTFSRTAALAREFGVALAAADLAVVVDVFPSREDAKDFPGVTGRLVAEATADAADGRTVAWLPGFDEAESYLVDRLRAGDLCLVLGAGDIDTLGRRLVAGG